VPTIGTAASIGSSPLSNVTSSLIAAAAAMVHGIRGEEEARRTWLDILTEMRRAVASTAGPTTAYMQVFEGLVALHRGELDDAVSRVADPPESFRSWHDGAWRQWYAAVWAEAVLAKLADRHDRLVRARFIVGRNPVASAIVDRAEAIVSGDIDMLLAAAAALDAAGCRYQHARTLVLAGGDARAEGALILAAIGAAPMQATG
jgi:hypothetical protein